MMSGIFDYFAWRGDLTPEQDALNEVDAVILARLSYLPFERIWEERGDGALTVAGAAEAMLAIPDLAELVLSDEDVRLLGELQSSTRFRNLEIFSFASEIDEETQTQFSAVAFQLAEDRVFIAFRGTDNTLVGWKEDFNMSFICPVPAQRLALHYTEGIAEKFGGHLILGGHSKGGNLAVYAAAFCDRTIQDRIDRVYNYDGPGFDDKVLDAEGYRKICERVRTFVPQSSIVGMLLGHKEKYTIVHSAQAIGPWQHDTYSWEVLRNHFVCLESVDQGSRILDYTLKAWIADLDYEQREQFVNVIYDILTETDAFTLRDLGENWFSSAAIVLKSVKNLDEPTRRAVSEALSLLMKSAKDGVTAVLREEWK